MKRIGRILFCLLPILLAEAVQFLISIPALGVTALSVILKQQQAALSLQQLYYEILSVLSSGTFLTVLSMLCAVCSLFLFGLWYWKKLVRVQERTRTERFNVPIVFSLLLLALGLQYVSTYLISFIGALRPDWIQAYEELMQQAGISSLSPLAVFYACIIAPVSEELIFRGVTLGYAKKAMPAVWAVCLQAVLFGVYHMNMVQGIYASMLGLFLGYLMEAGGTIAIPMLFHAFFNLGGMFASSYMYYRMDQTFFFLLWLTVGVLCTYAGVFLFQYGVRMRCDDV